MLQKYLYTQVYRKLKANYHIFLNLVEQKNNCKYMQMVRAFIAVFI